MQRAKRANELVAWVNRILHTTDVRTLDDLKSGVHLIQIFHSIDPDSFDLSRVDFRASNDYYYNRNLKLLQEVLKAQGLNINFHLEGVVQGEKRNDLYILVSYIMLHYAALKDRANQKSALTYDPVVQRKRAQEKRNSKHRPFRVAVRHGMPGSHSAAATAGTDDGDDDGAASTSTGPRRPVLTSRSLRPFSDVATVVSDTSQAYTTVSTKQTSTRMKQRREELQKLAMNAAPQLRRMSSIGSALDRSGAHTPLRPSGGGAAGGGGASAAAGSQAANGRSPLGVGGGSAMSSRMPTMSSYRDPTSSIDQRQQQQRHQGSDGCSRVAPVCTAINFEAIDLGPIGDLGCLTTWPLGEYMERDVVDASCFGSGSQRIASPGGGKSPRSPEGGRSPSQKSSAGKKASWSAFDAALEEFKAVADSFLLPIERADIAGIEDMQRRKANDAATAVAVAEDDDADVEHSNPTTVAGEGDVGVASAGAV